MSPKFPRGAVLTQYASLNTRVWRGPGGVGFPSHLHSLTATMSRKFR